MGIGRPAPAVASSPAVKCQEFGRMREKGFNLIFFLKRDAHCRAVQCRRVGDCGWWVIGIGVNVEYCMNFTWARRRTGTLQHITSINQQQQGFPLHCEIVITYVRLLTVDTIRPSTHLRMDGRAGSRADGRLGAQQNKENGTTV